MSFLYRLTKSSRSSSAPEKAAPSQKRYRVVSRSDLMTQHPELENNLTKDSLNEAVLRGFTKSSETPGFTAFHDDESAIHPIPVKESRRSFAVPYKTTSHPCFVPNNHIHTYYAQPIKTQNGVTEKDTALPGIRFLGGKVQLDKDTAPFKVLVFEPDNSHSEDDQCGTVVTGLKDDEFRNYWTGNRSSVLNTSSYFSVLPDTYTSIGQTSQSVLAHLLLSPPPTVFLTYSAELERAMLHEASVHSDQSAKEHEGSGPAE